MFRRLLAAGFAILALAGSVLVGQQQPDRARTDSMAERAGARLQALHDEAARLAGEERTLLGDLRRLELEREIRATELQRARQEARAVAEELAALDQQVASLTEQADAALPDLRARLVTLYKLGRGQYARLLLSATDLRQFAQAVRLVSALAEQDRQRIAQHTRRLAQLKTARAAGRERQSRSLQLQDAAQHAQTAADDAVRAHTLLVREIDSRRELNAQYASELIAAQERLQASVAGLGTSSSALSLPIAPFQGALDWPVIGPVRHQYGAVVSGRPPLRGIEIQAPDGATVRAVHDGTVAYADAFSGYGRLVIIDHGNQTFTLYGNLGEIAIEKGSLVERGRVIGTAGLDTASGAALYFELRVDGRVVDPLQWLGKR